MPDANEGKHCECCGDWLPAIVDRMNTWCREQGVDELKPWDWKAESVHRHIDYMHGAINGRHHDQRDSAYAAGHAAGRGDVLNILAALVLAAGDDRPLWNEAREALAAHKKGEGK